MKSPSFSISELMILVLFAGLDLGIGKALMGVPAFVPDLADLLIYGALPMVNILAIGLIRARLSRSWRGGNHHVLLGFVIGGLGGLLIYLACSFGNPRVIHEAVGGVLHGMGLSPGLIFVTAATTLLLLPQLALALLGARLSRRYRLRVRISIERRPEVPPDEETPIPRLGVALDS